MNATTARQQQVYDFLCDYAREYGCPPPIREMCAAFGISSPNGVMCHLKAMVKKGALRKLCLLNADGRRRATVYVPARPVIEVRALMKRVRITFTGSPVEMSFDEWRAWLAEQEKVVLPR